jgi:hypothetical protein
MVKIGNKYEFYFGNDIYIPYMVWDIDKSLGEEGKWDWVMTLITADDYAGCDRIMKVKYGCILGKSHRRPNWATQFIIK